MTETAVVAEILYKRLFLLAKIENIASATSTIRLNIYESIIEGYLLPFAYYVLANKSFLCKKMLPFITVDICQKGFLISKVIPYHGYSTLWI